MQDFGAQLWAAVGPDVLKFVVLVVGCMLTWASMKVIAWANGQKVVKDTSEAVVMAAKSTVLKTGEERLAAVQAAVPKATEAAIELAYAKLVKPTKACPPPTTD